MRAVFGLLGLVVVLVVVGVLVRKSLHSSQESMARQTPTLPTGHNQSAEPATAREQSQQIQQIQQQYRQQLESALNARRPEQDQAR